MSLAAATSTEGKGGLPARPAAGSYLPGMTEMQMKTSYFQKLRDPRWQKKRLEALDAADWSCQRCCDKESTLNVHHKQYFKGREPWDYEVKQLAVLCEDCHQAEHGAPDELLVAASYAPIDGPIDRQTAACVLAGLIDQPLGEELNQFKWAQSAHFVGEIACWLIALYLNKKGVHERMEQLDSGEVARVMAIAFINHFAISEPDQSSPPFVDGEF